ncbi:ERI1 exoribonuclease 2-like [Ylistrum balloti]|uniref:ERI1 exoribonuclease 2-like n=1 Tax=Ylistrum balloti TaxID=509963 RepID=UPI0029059297|nr:ERI1 exoribonuclease 2-like [Ylistrum balloti]
MKTTKELARELGLLRERTLSTSAGSKKSRSPSQPFGYLIVLDFESTCWKEKKFQTQEIIEFPAVLLNTTTGDIESEFHYYVQPQEQPILSEFCQELTGITQEQVDEGIPLRFCLKKFSKWLDGLCKDKGITFSPVVGQQSRLKATTFVTWSDWDLGVCLFNECKRKQLLRPAQLNSWIDLRATYRKFYNRRPQGLNGALQDLGITFEGREHSGLHDSRNTARLAWRMTRDGCVLTTTKTLKLSEESSSKTRIPKALPVDSSTAVRMSQTDEHHVAVNKASSDVQNLKSPSRSPCHKKRKTDTLSSPTRKPSNTALGFVVLSPRTARSKIPVRSPKASDHRNISTTTKLSIVDQIYRDPGDENSTATCLSKQNGKKSLTGLKSRDNNILCCTRQLNQTTKINSTFFKTPKNIKITVPNIEGKDSSKHQSKSASFRIPLQMEDPQSRTMNSSVFSGKSTGQETLTSFTSYVTPTNSSIRKSDNRKSGMKETPPLCRCGKRSKRRMAQTPGPNMGRFFFTCGAGSRPSKPQENRKGCEYFKWESVVRTDTNNSYNSSFQSDGNRSDTGLPFKQVVLTSGFSQRKSLGIRSTVLRPPIR